MGFWSRMSRSERGSKDSFAHGQCASLSSMRMGVVSCVCVVIFSSSMAEITVFISS